MIKILNSIDITNLLAQYHQLEKEIQWTSSGHKGQQSGLQFKDNEDPWTSVRALEGGDVLVMSHSSFSVMGAIMNPKGIILYHPFWHKPMTRWLNTTSPSFPKAFIDALTRL
jgi:hypothetical protein